MSKTTWAVVILGALCLSFAGTVAVLWATLDTAHERILREETAHNATRRDYARDKGLWLFDQRNANATIAGLQRQANATALNRTAARAAEVERFAIFTTSTIRTVKPVEVVDDATCRAAAVHINGAFRRASGL